MFCDREERSCSLLLRLRAGALRLLGSGSNPEVTSWRTPDALLESATKTVPTTMRWVLGWALGLIISPGISVSVCPSGNVM